MRLHKDFDPIVKVKTELDERINSVKQNQLVSKSEQETDMDGLQKSLNFKINSVTSDSNSQINELKKNISQDMQHLKTELSKFFLLSKFRNNYVKVNEYCINKYLLKKCKNTSVQSVFLVLL
jgi:hypothetical protein